MPIIIEKENKIISETLQTIKRRPGLVKSRAIVAEYLGGLPSKDSRRVSGGSLNTIAGALTGGAVSADRFPWALLRARHVSFLRGALAGAGYSNRTVNRLLSIARSVLKVSYARGCIPWEDYAPVLLVRGLPIDRELRGRRLTAGEICALFESCSAAGNVRGLRDAVIIALGYGCGLRRREIVSLVADGVDFQAAELDVIGKGRIRRKIPIPRGTLDALGIWFVVCGLQGSDPVFPGRAGRTLTPEAVFYICRRRALAAGVKNFSPHDLRRSFASDLFEYGADSRTVQRLLGHAQVNTVERYDLRDRKVLAGAVSKLHVPFLGKKLNQLVKK